MSAGEDRTKTETGGREEESDRTGSLVWLWAGLLVAPMAFLFNLQANYTLTQKLCPEERISLLHIVTLIFLLMAALGGLIAWRSWKRAGSIWPDESEERIVRNRFMAIVGLMISALCLLGIIAQWIPQLIFSPCQR